jgi:hypothetical protein
MEGRSVHGTNRLKKQNKTKIMEKNWIILAPFALILIGVLIFMIRKNHRDRKNLFKDVPGDYPDPKKVKSEFDFDFNSY